MLVCSCIAPAVFCYHLANLRHPPVACRPPPPPYALGTAQTIITSDQTSDLTGVIYPGPANKVQVGAAAAGVVRSRCQ